MLVDRELADQLHDLPGYKVRRLKRVSVRGYDHLQPFLVRRRREGDDSDDDSPEDELTDDGPAES
jgi:adenylate cyclase